MSYWILKNTHIACAIVSISFFLVRAYWMLSQSRWLQQKWVKVLPHIIDTLLLASAIGLTIILKQYPFTHSWLTAKVIALLAYIIFGAIALTHGKTKNIRIMALAIALLSVSYIVLVARTHNPLIIFG